MAHEGTLEILFPFTNNIIHRFSHSKLMDQLELLLGGKREIFHHANLVGRGDVGLADLTREEVSNELCGCDCRRGER